jgi:hypothetical protein
MDTEKHNGHYNFSTWQFNLNITNSEANVNYLRENKEDLLKLKDSDLLDNLINSLEFWDTPDRENIYVPELRETIKEV